MDSRTSSRKGIKAILIIDMPKHCIECPICSLNEMTGLYNCMDGTKNEKCVDDYLIGNYGNKPQWCPLKPLPNLIENLGLEVWKSSKGGILAPKDLFNEIWEDDEE